MTYNDLFAIVAGVLALGIFCSYAFYTEGAADEKNRTAPPIVFGLAMFGAASVTLVVRGILYLGMIGAERIGGAQ